MIQWVDEPPRVLGQLPREGPDGTVCISQAQRDRHVFWETAALVVVVPFSLFLAFNPALAPWARLLAGGIAGATVVVDGGLLRQYRRAR